MAKNKKKEIWIAIIITGIVIAIICTHFAMQNPCPELVDKVLPDGLPKGTGPTVI